jgi:hypothetical protein
MRRRTNSEQEAKARADRAAKELRASDSARSAMGLPLSTTDGQKIYGFTMGPVSELSPEAAALSDLDIGDQQMTPFRAAVYQASKDVGRHFNVHLRTRLSAKEDQAAIGGGFRVKDDDPAAEYARCYARYALDFVKTQMARHSDQTPRPEKIARHFIQILEQSRIDPDAAIAELQVATEKDVRVLAQQAYRLRQRS